MRYAEHHKMAGSILVAPCYTDLGMESEKVSDWYDAPWLGDAIRKNQQVVGLLYSTNDQYIPLNEFEHIKEQLKPIYTFESSKDAHFTELQIFPQISDCLKEIKKNC